MGEKLHEIPLYVLRDQFELACKMEQYGALLEHYVNEYCRKHISRPMTRGQHNWLDIVQKHKKIYKQLRENRHESVLAATNRNKLLKRQQTTEQQIRMLEQYKRQATAASLVDLSEAPQVKRKKMC